MNAFRKETQRQKVMIKKAKICEAKLMILLGSFKRLVEDDNFINLLRAEGFGTMPLCLAEAVKSDTRRAA